MQQYTHHFHPKTSQIIQRVILPVDTIEVTDAAAKQITDALQSGLAFRIIDQDTIDVAPSVQHAYFTDKKRWIAYIYKYSPSTGSFYPLSMLSDYPSLPNDLIDTTAEAHTAAQQARNKGLKFVVKTGGESIDTAPDTYSDWDAKKGAWVRDEKRAESDAKDAQIKALDAAKLEAKARVNSYAANVAARALGTDSPVLQMQLMSKVEAAKAFVSGTASEGQKSMLSAEVAVRKKYSIDELAAVIVSKSKTSDVLVGTVQGMVLLAQDSIDQAKTVEQVGLALTSLQNQAESKLKVLLGA